MVKNTGSKDNNNNSSNSLVFGPWPQTKMGDKAETYGQLSNEFHSS